MKLLKILNNKLLFNYQLLIILNLMKLFKILNKLLNNKILFNYQLLIL